MLLPLGLPVNKRVFDLIATTLGLIVLSPFILLTAISVRIFLGTPIIFRQERAGYKGHPFFIYKFRTMTDATDASGNLLPDSRRLTRLGRFLRALSLDELPELFNILRGEMSLVGPRPLLMEYLERYSSEQKRRHDVYPGLTGWAQVNGRNAITWQDKFALDVWYVDHWSFWLDIKIIFMTPWKVLTREGINKPGQTTTEYFMGNPNDDELSELVTVIDELIQLLEADGEEHWSRWMRASRDRLSVSDHSGIEHLLSAYGGMGSFNDLVVCQSYENGQFHWKEGYVEKNNQLNDLRSKAWELANSIRRESTRK